MMMFVKNIGGILGNCQGVLILRSGMAKNNLIQCENNPLSQLNICLKFQNNSKNTLPLPSAMKKSKGYAFWLFDFCRM